METSHYEPRATEEMAARWWNRIAPNWCGAAWMIGASLCYATVVIVVKTLTNQGFHPFQVIFFRSAFALLIALPFFIGEFRAALTTRRRGLHFLHGMILTGATCSAFYAFSKLPLATSVSLTFTKPLFITLLAVPVFGEVIGWRRWIAVAMGFAGVLVMVPPGFGGTLHLAALAGVTAALLFAIQAIIGKRLVTTEGIATIILFSVILPVLVSSALALPAWRSAGFDVLALGTLMGGAGTGAQFCTVRATRIADASAVAPFDYFRLHFAAFYGFAIFAEIPGAFTLLGAGIIVASTLYITRRERPGAPA